MRAVQVERYGDPSVLQLTDRPVPEPGAGEVLIQVRHAGVNFAEVMFRRGQFEIGVPHVPGLEAAGTVAALGDGVSGLTVGTPVAALTLAGGGYAEYVVAPADFVVATGDLDPALPAAFPCNVTVAHGLLADAARLRVGDRVLVLAAAGGIGTAVAQLARRMGAGAVYGVTSTTAKAEYAAGYGYDAVFGYDAMAAEVAERTGGEGVDLVLDSVGGAARAGVAELLAPLGRHVVFGDAADDGDRTVSGNDLWGANTAMGGYNLGGIAGARPRVLAAQLAQAAAAVAAGGVRIDVTELPLTDAAKAHELLESRASTGKYVLRVRD